MRIGFQTPLETTVTLAHGAETVTLRVSACPPGWPTYVETVMPQPVEYVQGNPRPALAKMPQWRLRSDMLLIAKCLGDQVETPFPTGAAPSAWEKAADDILAEFSAAGLTEGDLAQVAAAIRLLNAGGKDTGGKAPS